MKFFFTIYFILFSFLGFAQKIDSLEKKKVHHAISIEGQLHNNFLYQSMAKKYNIFTNYLGGDTINESKLQPRYYFSYNARKNKFNLFVGLAYNKHHFIYTLPSSPYVEFQYYHFSYKILEMPLGIGFSRNYHFLKPTFWFGLIPEIVLSETRGYSNSISNNAKFTDVYNLNIFSLSGNIGFNLSYCLFNKLDLLLSVSAKASLFPISYRISIVDIWLNYSSLNFGLGVKYNIR